MNGHQTALGEACRECQIGFRLATFAGEPCDGYRAVGAVGGECRAAADESAASGIRLGCASRKSSPGWRKKGAVGAVIESGDAVFRAWYEVERERCAGGVARRLE